MDTFLRVDINIVAIILLGTVYFIAYQSLDRKDRLNGKFLSTSLIIVLELLFETLTCVINKRPEPWLIPVSVILHICLFITAPILTYFCYTFVRSWVVPDGAPPRKKHLLLLVPIAINSIITVLSPINGMVFSVSDINVYRRGELFVLSDAITYFYLLISLALVLKRRKRIIRHEFIPLLLISVFTTIGGLFQAMFYGVLLMWSSAAFTLVIVYIFLEKRMIHLDNLTGAWTRESFNHYCMQKVLQTESETFGIIYIDIDGLKQINDQHGHVEGDFALKTAVQVLRNSLRKTDIVARVGGDEFIVILECESRDVLEKTIERIQMNLAQHNQKSGKEYNLECSFGADLYKNCYSSIEQFIHHVDSLMYGNKKIKA